MRFAFRVDKHQRHSGYPRIGKLLSELKYVPVSLFRFQHCCPAYNIPQLIIYQIAVDRMNAVIIKT